MSRKDAFSKRRNVSSIMLQRTELNVSIAIQSVLCAFTRTHL